MTYSFFCPCVPPTATAQQKGVMVRGGRPLFYTKKTVTKSQDFFTALFHSYRPPCPFNGPVKVTVVLTFPWRKGEPKRNRARGWLPMPVAPDWDNLAKTPFDVLSKLSFWCNDGQIYDGRVIKGWGNLTGVRVTLREVDEDEDFSHMIGAGDDQ